MKLTFYKYQGAGNDFILIDNRLDFFPSTNQKLIRFLCDRRFGIGADGLILLENTSEADFKMKYFNADGKEGSMCGNGGRCIVAFAKHQNIISKETTFKAIDGLHYALINNGKVSLKMGDVSNIELGKEFTFLNTGSPHHITFLNNIQDLDVKNEGAKIRYSNRYKNNGTNVNFVEQINDSKFKVRTYERGVENETLACGTGVTAVAIAAHNTQKTNANNINLEVLGGNLEVSFTEDNGVYKNIMLTGPATFVFKGEIHVA